MDVGFLNSLGICLAGIVGIGIFYYVGHTHPGRSARRKDACPGAAPGNDSGKPAGEEGERQ